MKKQGPFYLETKPRQGFLTIDWLVFGTGRKSSTLALAFSEHPGSLRLFPPSLHQHQQIGGEAKPNPEVGNVRVPRWRSSRGLRFIEFARAGGSMSGHLELNKRGLAETTD